MFSDQAESNLSPVWIFPAETATMFPIRPMHSGSGCEIPVAPSHSDCSAAIRKDKKTGDKKTGDKKNPPAHLSAKPQRLSEEDFAVFWKAYPRKESKVQARKAFAKVDGRLDILLQALEAQKQTEQWRRDGGQFIPYASTWLNQKRWEDELPAQPGNDSMLVDGWGAEHPDWSDQSTWVTGPDGIPRPVGVAP